MQQAKEVIMGSWVWADRIKIAFEDQSAYRIQEALKANNFLLTGREGESTKL